MVTSPAPVSMVTYIELSNQPLLSTEHHAISTTPNRDVEALWQLPHLESNRSNRTHSKMSSILEGNNERFCTFVDDDKLAILSKGVVPANTDQFFGLEGG